MFKRLSVQTNTRLVRTPPKDGETSEGMLPDILDAIQPNITLTPEGLYAYSEVAKDFITHVALVGGGTYIACRIVRALTK